MTHISEGGPVGTGDRATMERYVVFAFGVVFLAAITALLVTIPKPTLAQFFAFRLSLALSAAGIGAFVPGFVHFQQPLPFKGLIRCGGAVALFAAVWFGNPAQYAIEEIAPPPLEDARIFIDSYLAANDREDYAAGYAMFSNRMKASMPYEAYLQLANNVRKPLGKRVMGPVIFSTQTAEELAGQKGPFLVNAYQSRFINQQELWVEVAGVVAEEGVWRMHSYNVGPCALPFCQAIPSLLGGK